MNISSLQRKKVAELQQIARDLDIQDYSHLRKEDLIYQILEANAEADSESDSETDRDAERSRRRSPAQHGRASTASGSSGARKSFSMNPFLN